MLNLSRESTSYERKRANRACNICRTRKTKCDNHRPKCGFCQATGGECRYPDDDFSEHSKLDRGTLVILQKMAEMEQELGNLIRRGRSPSRSSEPTAVLPRVVDTPTSGSTSDMLAPSHPPNARMIIEGAEITVDKIFAWPVFEFRRIDPVSTVTWLSHRQILGARFEESNLELDSKTIHHLVENFLANNHIKNPIFDTDSLWAQVQSFVQDGLGWNQVSCLILSICAVSTIAPDVKEEAAPGHSKRPDPLARAELFFQAAQRRIGLLHHETSLIAIQCSFLTAIYLMSTFRILAAWKAFSQASTQCVGWLATREVSSHKQRLYVEESLYWSCLKSELELRSELCLPGSSLNEMHYPHIYPSLPTFDENGDQLEHPSVFSTIPGNGYMLAVDRERLERGWFFYLAEIALRRIMNDALSSRYNHDSWYYSKKWWTESESASYFRHLDTFKTKLKTWYEMLPPVMSFTLDPLERLGDPLRGILRGHYVDIEDILYFPAVRAVVCKPLNEVSDTIVEVAWQGLRVCMNRIVLCREGFWHRHQGTWLMIRTCSRSALQLIAVARRARQTASSHGNSDILARILPDNWRDAVNSVIELIRYWQDESPDLSILASRLHQELHDL